MARKREEPVKQCKDCHRILAATPENFPVTSTVYKGKKKYYLRDMCRTCRNKKARDGYIDTAAYLRAKRIIEKEMQKEGVK